MTVALAQGHPCRGEETVTLSPRDALRPRATGEAEPTQALRKHPKRVGLEGLPGRRCSAPWAFPAPPWADSRASWRFVAKAPGSATVLRLGGLGHPPDHSHPADQPRDADHA